MLKIIALTLLLSGIGLADPSVDVVTQGEDAYLVSGRFLLTDAVSDSASTAAKAASCIGCKWHLQKICPDPANSPQHFGYNCSKPETYTCAGGASRYQIWFLDSGLWKPGDWQLRGTSCIGPKGPKPITQLQTEVLDTAVGYLPDLKLQLRPKVNSLVNLPTKVLVKSPNVFRFEVVVAGVLVQVNATASYRYEFQDGNTITTINREINHVYRSRGKYPIKVTAIWQATWQTPLHGNNPVPGDQLTQQQIIDADVIAARGRLVKR